MFLRNTSVTSLEQPNGKRGRGEASPSCRRPTLHVNESQARQQAVSRPDNLPTSCKGHRRHSFRVSFFICLKDVVSSPFQGVSTAMGTEKPTTAENFEDLLAAVLRQVFDQWRDSSHQQEVPDLEKKWIPNSPKYRLLKRVFHSFWFTNTVEAGRYNNFESRRDSTCIYWKNPENFKIEHSLEFTTSVSYISTPTKTFLIQASFLLSSVC